MSVYEVMKLSYAAFELIIQPNASVFVVSVVWPVRVVISNKIYTEYGCKDRVRWHHSNTINILAYSDLVSSH